MKIGKQKTDTNITDDNKQIIDSQQLMNHWY